VEAPGTGATPPPMASPRTASGRGGIKNNHSADVEYMYTMSKQSVVARPEASLGCISPPTHPNFTTGEGFMDNKHSTDDESPPPPPPPPRICMSVHPYAPILVWCLFSMRDLRRFPEPQMAINGAQICDLEKIDGQICHTMVQYGDSTVYFSTIGDRHLRYPGKNAKTLLSGRTAASWR